MAHSLGVTKARLTLLTPMGSLQEARPPLQTAGHKGRGTLTQHRWSQHFVPLLYWKRDGTKWWRHPPHPQLGWGSIHTHLAAILVGCLGWGSLLDSWLLASRQGAYGNFHEDAPNCSYLAYQEAQAIGINQFRKKKSHLRQEGCLAVCSLGYLLLQSL